MKRPTRRLSDEELREFDELVRCAIAGVPRPTRTGYVPRAEAETDHTIGQRFGLKVADVRRLKAERA